MTGQVFFSPQSFPFGKCLTKGAKHKHEAREVFAQQACIGHLKERPASLACHAGPIDPRNGLPVLTPHAPSRKRPAIYRGPERGTNPPAMFAGARGSSSNTLGRPTVVFLSASRPQVGGLTSDSSLAGHGPLVKAREAVCPQSGVGRFHGVGVMRLQEEAA